MANAIPLLEGTDASGGYLVRDTYGQTLQNGILRESAVMSLSRVDRVPGKRQRYTVYAGRPTAQFVSEGAAKPTTGAEFAEVVVNVKKIASQVIYTEELLEDAAEDPRVLVNADVQSAIADLIDAHALGYAAGSTVSTSFDTALTSTTSSVELGSSGDALASAVSSAFNTIESNGYTPSGIILASDGRAHLRDARRAVETTAPVYTASYEREPDTLYGAPIRYSSNLPRFSATKAASKIVGIVGDFSGAIAAMRADISVRTSDQASIDVSGTVQHLWQQNKMAVQWETRLGFTAHDLSKRFVVIKDAT
jgi:HK97 family phage major capsid protein